MYTERSDVKTVWENWQLIGGPPGGGGLPPMVQPPQWLIWPWVNI